MKIKKAVQNHCTAFSIFIAYILLLVNGIFYVGKFPVCKHYFVIACKICYKALETPGNGFISRVTGTDSDGSLLNMQCENIIRPILVP